MRPICQGIDCDHVPTVSIAKGSRVGLNAAVTAAIQKNLFDADGQVRPLRLMIHFSAVRGDVAFTWFEEGQTDTFAEGILAPFEVRSLHDLGLTLTCRGEVTHDACTQHTASVRGLINRMRKRLPVPDAAVQVCLELARDHGQVKAGEVYPQPFSSPSELWTWTARLMSAFARLVDRSWEREPTPAQERSQLALQQALKSSLSGGVQGAANPSGDEVTVEFIIDYRRGQIRVEWRQPAREGDALATGKVTCIDPDELTWEWTEGSDPELLWSTYRRGSVRQRLRQWRNRFPILDSAIRVRLVKPGSGADRPAAFEDPPPWEEGGPWQWLEDVVLEMAGILRARFDPWKHGLPDPDLDELTEFGEASRMLARRGRKLAEAEARLREGMHVAAQKRMIRQAEMGAAKLAQSAQARSRKEAIDTPSPQRPPLPALPVRLDAGELALQDTVFALTDLGGYFLREQAARWWVSNQTDDLICLPFCRIARLEYQIRTALRVIGPLRGRALLSDEVGLGKTIEAGLVLKEYLTRGLVRRFLVLTVPSLVDQWAEELEEKFHLQVSTTNDAAFRADPDLFWAAGDAVVASLHTVKQAAHLARAQQVKWDLLIVDEAHYLRNRSSQAWQAVSLLPRQFLLLLTATPVQNSIEELYNLVTLLQPGHLPSPKEFRTRFVDPKRPHRPREPDELRRLLWQVMIRNTRANAGLELPARRAETVVFEPAPAEAAFQAEWEREFRAVLGRLKTSEASLWGRLVLQAIGSSPAAWRRVLERFPDRTESRRWIGGHGLEESWERKWRILPPLAAGEGGVVVFTQFLETQAGLARALAESGVPTHAIHGQTPAPQRQPITEAFRREGGALLLTHSGTEGRNLQFCHRLVNFDLPWNPMEIEQRIGRLHRIGQQHVVRIHNLVSN